MGLELTSAPALEPVSLDEAKAHLRVDTTDEDALIARLAVAARESAEAYTRRAFIAQSWRLTRDAWPASGTLLLPKPPLSSVTAVTLTDRSGAASVLSDDLYIVDGAAVPGRIVLKETAVLPSFLREANAIAVDFSAGYGDEADDVPAAIRSAILHWTAHFYESRGDVAAPPPAQALALLAPFRVIGL
jgi:uncharacterized phiE125 gp8 family phage protein